MVGVPGAFGSHFSRSASDQVEGLMKCEIDQKMFRRMLPEPREDLGRRERKQVKVAELEENQDEQLKTENLDWVVSLSNVDLKQLLASSSLSSSPRCSAQEAAEDAAEEEKFFELNSLDKIPPHLKKKMLSNGKQTRKGGSKRESSEMQDQGKDSAHQRKPDMPAVEIQ